MLWKATAFIDIIPETQGPTCELRVVHNIFPSTSAFVLMSRPVTPKAKTVSLHATKVLGWRGGIASAHSRPRLHFSPGKGPQVPTVQEAGWAPELVWTQRLQEKSLCLCWGSKLDRPVVQPVTILTELPGSLQWHLVSIKRTLTALCARLVTWDEWQFHCCTPERLTEQYLQAGAYSPKYWRSPAYGNIQFLKVLCNSNSALSRNRYCNELMYACVLVHVCALKNKGMWKKFNNKISFTYWKLYCVPYTTICVRSNSL
jgi:hypothetical protein